MKINQQPIEKRVKSSLLDVHSIFSTIQGEGPFCGMTCVFIRLAGCNLQCPACDTEYTKGRSQMYSDEVVAQVDYLHPAPKQGRRLVVITGGEPFRQDLAMLLYKLNQAGYFVQIETNGTLPPSDYFYNLNISEMSGAYIVCSPKSGKVNPAIWDQACCAKYVMEAGNVSDDGLPITALMHSANPRVARPPSGWTRPIYLQPMDAQNESENLHNVSTVVESCMKFGYILQLQIHKIIGVE